MATSQSSDYPTRVSTSANQRDPHKYVAARIAGFYLVAGMVWIGLSDLGVARTGGLTPVGLLMEMGKGALFVLLSSALVYWLCRREYRKLRLATDLLRSVVEGTTDAVFVKDLDGKYLLVNAAAAQFMGRSVEEVLGRDDTEMFDAIEAESLMANDRAIIAAGKAVTLEEKLTSEGQTRTYQATKAPYLDTTGKPIGLIGIGRDVTEVKRVESALHETDDRLREAQRIARLGSWCWEPAANRVWWSDAEFELFGASPREVTPGLESFLSFLHPEDRPVAIERVEAMLAGADGFANDLRVMRRDGSCMWIHSQARATRDLNGELVRVEGIDQDITEQRQYREALLESQRRLQAAVEVAGLGVIGVDYVSQLADLSPRAAEHFGFAEGSKVSRAGLHARFHPADIEELNKLIADALDPNGTGGFVLEHRVVRPDGSVRWLNVRKQVTFEKGLPYSAVIVTADVTDQRMAEAKYREQEMLVREAVELAKVGGWGFDPKTLQSDWTPAVAKMYGLDPDAPPAVEKALEFFNPEQRPVLEAALEASMRDGTQHDIELQLTAADGVERWVRSICRPIVDGGKVTRVRGSLQDITDRKRIESELRTSEERYRLLFEANPHPMWVYDVDTLSFLAVNDAAVQAYGYTRDEFLAMTILEIRPAEDVPKLQTSIISAKLERSYRGYWRHQRKDGTVIDVDISSHELPRKQGRSRLVLALDITDRKRAELERERSAALLRSVLDSVGDAIITINTRGIITSANRSTERLFGYTIAELLGVNVSVLMPEPHRQQHDHYVAEYLSTRVRRVIGVGREVEGLRKDGSVFPAELTITEFVRDGQLEFTGVLRDITARRQLEEQFRQAQKMDAVGRLAGGVAHDFNNLLTVINGYSELVLTELPADDPSRGPLAAIHDAGDRAARLTEQLLAFSRKSMIEPQLVDLNKLVIESAKLFRRLIGEDIALSVLTDPSPVHVVLDPGQLEQVLMNLAINARDAMPTGGRLTIETRIIELELGLERMYPDLPPGRYASLRVADTGCGINAEVREKIFEPFFTTKGVGKGTGLGLAVVHGIVQQSGGSITVESTLGAGTSFHILLPAVSEATKEAGLREAPFAASGDETVLVVEDEEAVRTLIRVALEGQGYTVLAASEGNEARQVLLAHARPVDILLTDVIMPEISGRELATLLREIQPGLRVCYMSGYTDDALDRHGLQGSSDQFIQKPFTPLGLARMLREIIDQSKIG